MKNLTKVKKTTLSAQFDILKKTFKNALDVQLKYASTTTERNIITGINIKIENGNLIMVSTTGEKLLKQEITLDYYNGKDFESVTYSGDYLRGIKIFKQFGSEKREPLEDYLRITLKKDSLIIKDLANNIVYNVPSLGCDYPPTEKFMKIPQNCQTVGINLNFLNDLKKMPVNCRTNFLKIHINKDSATEPIIIETDNKEGVKALALLMPMQARD